MLILEGEHPVAELVFTPDGTRLVVARARWYPPELWSSEVRTLATGECLRLWTPETKSYPAIAVHPSGRFALFAFWHGNSIHASKHPLAIVSLIDGTGQPISGRFADQIAASPDSKWIVAREGSSQSFIGYRCDPEAKPVCWGIWRAAPNVASEHLGGFVGNGDRFVTIGRHRIIVRDTGTGEVRTTIKYSAPSVTGPITSPDGRLLAARGSTQFCVWDTVTWEKRLQLATENRPLVHYAFHPTRPILAAIQNGQPLVKYLDVNTGEVIRKFQWKLGEMRSVCFSPDGTLAAVGSASGKIVVWDVDE